MRTSLSGLIVPLVTPMNEDLSIDYFGFKNLISRLMNKGVRNFFLLSYFGEESFLSDKSRRAIISFVNNSITSNCNLLVGCFGLSTDEIIEKVRFAEKYSEYCVVNVPYACLTNDIDFVDFFDKLFRKTKAKIILYNSPKDFKRNIPVAGLNSIVGWERLVAIIDNSNNLTYFNALGDYHQQIKILQYSEEKSVESFNYNCFSVVPPMANVFPELFINLKKDFEEVGYPGMVRKELNILNCISAFPKNKKIQSYKKMLSLMGLIQEFFSLDLEGLDEKEVDSITAFSDSIKQKN